MSLIWILAVAASLDGSAIPRLLHGDWAPSLAKCADPVERLTVSAQQLEWYEADAYLLLGVQFTDGEVVNGRDGPGLIGRFLGKDIDSTEGMFFSADYQITPTRTGMQIVRLDEKGAETQTITYSRCPSKQVR